MDRTGRKMPCSLTVGWEEMVGPHPPIFFLSWIMWLRRNGGTHPLFALLHLVSGPHIRCMNAIQHGNWRTLSLSMTHLLYLELVYSAGVLESAKGTGERGLRVRSDATCEFSPIDESINWQCCSCHHLTFPYHYQPVSQIYTESLGSIPVQRLEIRSCIVRDIIIVVVRDVRRGSED